MLKVGMLESSNVGMYYNGIAGTSKSNSESGFLSINHLPLRVLLLAGGELLTNNSTFDSGDFEERGNFYLLS